MKTIAVFDFDGTITTKDTLFDFIKFSLGADRLFMGLFYLFPILLLYKLKIVTNHTAKEVLFNYFFQGMNKNDYDKYCKLYTSRIDKITNPKAIEKILWHRNQGHSVICASASIEDWIIPWAKENNIELVIATKIKSQNGIITGKFLSKNCYGEEKVKRFLAMYPERSAYVLYAYGDSRGDRELLDLADLKFYKCF